MTSHVFLASVVEEFEAYASRLQSANVEISVKIDEAHGKLGVELKGSRVLGVLQAWEHAHCVDFDYMKLPSGEAHILFAGECESAGALAKRLRSVVECVLEHQQVGTH